MDTERNINIKMIRSEELPDSVGGCILKQDGDDNYMMMINSEKSERAQVIAFLHDCLHIWHRDHDRRDPVDVIEKERHDELLELLELAQSNTW